MTSDLLVTGGTGLIGSHFCKYAEKRGHSIKVLTRRASSLKKDFSCEIVDFKKRSDFRKIGKIRSGIVHFYSPLTLKYIDSIRREVATTKRLLELWEDGPFVYSSSMSLYRSSNQPLQETQASLFPQNGYCLGKLLTEWLIRKKAERENKPFVILRIPHVFEINERSAGTLFDRLLRKALNGEDFIFPLEFLEQGDEFGISWIGLDDLSEALIQVLDKQISGVFNVSSGFVTWVDLAEKILRTTGRGGRILFHQGAAPGFNYNRQKIELDTRKFCASYDFRANADLDDILDEALKGFKGHLD